MPRLSASLVIFILVASASAAFGQPGQQAPGSSPPAEAGQPPPGPQLVEPEIRTTIPMSEEDRELILRGEIPIENHVIGAAAAFMFGFGTGHALQRRWSRTGWIYTFGEIAALGLLIYGLDDCITVFDERSDCTATGIGFFGLVGLRLAEMVDTVIYPPIHNGRVRDARMRHNIRPMDRPYRARLHLGPARGGGVTGGFGFSF